MGFSTVLTQTQLGKKIKMIKMDNSKILGTLAKLAAFSSKGKTFIQMVNLEYFLNC